MEYQLLRPCFSSLAATTFLCKAVSLWLPIILLLLPLHAGASSNGCLICHANEADGFSEKHEFARQACTTCHKGDSTAAELPQAHRALVAYPGDMAHASEACGGCHAQRVSGVEASQMHTGKGMVAKTREAFGEIHAIGMTSIQSLGHSPADSLLRKLCVSCHLGNSKHAHALDVTRDRGGGCSACHINNYPQDRHPALTSRVEDGRCFGCHSRSGRISLNYTGLAEAIAGDTDTGEKSPLLQLADGRTVIKKQSDVHHAAGLSCIDCHTSTGLMGGRDNSQHQRQAVDISCEDCHGTPQTITSRELWPDEHDKLKQYLAPDTPPDTRIPVTHRSSTPLWHTRLDENGNATLKPKLGGPARLIPRYSSASHALEQEHQQLHCSACHSQWAPQCYGCHIEYDPAGKQKDHLLKHATAGRWNERRWDVRSDLPPLGVAADGMIRPFVPGMIMSVAHPDWTEERFQRQFTASEPHTTGKSRSCESCHHSSKALGLGRGRLILKERTWHFVPEQEAIQDGLPGDAWTTLSATRSDAGSNQHNRPFTQDEMVRILEAIP